MRPWLLPAVYERLRAGRGEFLAELRPAIPVFVRFGGIDYDADDAAADKLERLRRAAPSGCSPDAAATSCSSMLGDKGAYLYAVFGSPHAHEDDAARAPSPPRSSCATRSTASPPWRTSRSASRPAACWSGTYGHAMRRTFTCLGDAVNLAARLMSKAPPGGVYVDRGGPRAGRRRVRVGARSRDAGQGQGRAGHGLRRSSERRAAGRAGDGATARARRAAHRAAGARHGARRLARGARARRRHRRRGGHGQVAARRRVRPLGPRRAAASSPSASARRSGPTPATAVWREIWRTLLGSTTGQPEEVQVAALEQRLAAIDPALAARAPLLESCSASRSPTPS